MEKASREARKYERNWPLFQRTERLRSRAKTTGRLRIWDEAAKWFELSRKGDRKDGGPSAALPLNSNRP